jgi:gp16 family phage-associated protein
MRRKRLLTLDEARDRTFTRTGVSQAEWAREHDVNKTLVSQILSGQRKCLRGQSHRIAVLLGIKAGDFF